MGKESAIRKVNILCGSFRNGAKSCFESVIRRWKTVWTLESGLFDLMGEQDLCLDHIQPHGNMGELDSVFHLEFFHEVGAVHVHSFRADMKCFSYVMRVFAIA